MKKRRRAEKKEEKKIDVSVQLDTHERRGRGKETKEERKKTRRTRRTRRTKRTKRRRTRRFVSKKQRRRRSEQNNANKQHTNDTPIISSIPYKTFSCGKTAPAENHVHMPKTVQKTRRKSMGSGRCC